MLRTAVEARLPLIVARTHDPQNAMRVIEVVTGQVPRRLAGLPRKNHLYVADSAAPPNVAEQCERVGASLILLNPEMTPLGAFDVGDLEVPRKLLARVMAESGVDFTVRKKLLPYLSGLTVSEAQACLKLTFVREPDLTPDGLLRTRRDCFPKATGIRLVDTNLEHYQPHKALTAWADKNRPFFLARGHDSRFVPRGLLFHGPPGTGKTLGAKHLSASWNVPLYRLDLGAMKHKYVGDSERNLRRALRNLDSEEPCIALFDEVEKFFGATDDDGVTTALLGELLWWFQERRSRVLTILTTNDVDAIPPELIRPGRIDAWLHFDKLTGTPLRVFTKRYAQTLDLSADAVEAMLVPGAQLSQAEVVARLIDLAKEEADV